jgi:hypothetical protein
VRRLAPAPSDYLTASSSVEMRWLENDWAANGFPPLVPSKVARRNHSPRVPGDSREFQAHLILNSDEIE